MTKPDNILAVDQYFDELGLKPEQTNSYNQKWSGNYNGRALTILFSRRTKAKYYGEQVRTREYVGHQVVFETPVKVATRFSASRDKSNSKLAKKLRSLVSLVPLEIKTNSCKELSVYTCDIEWADEFISDKTVQEVLSGELLLIKDAQNIVFALYPCEGSTGGATFNCRMPLASISPGKCKIIIESLIKLADSCEKYTPRRVVSISWFEKFIREKPLFLFFIIAAFIIFFGLVFSAFLIVIAYSGITPLVVPAFIFGIYLLYRRYLK